VAEPYALRACQALADEGVLSAGLRFGTAAVDAVMQSLLSSGQRAGITAFDYSCLP
jgi:hypothetical protein